jgi:hypothetical protein
MGFRCGAGAESRRCRYTMLLREKAGRKAVNTHVARFIIGLPIVVIGGAFVLVVVTASVKLGLTTALAVFTLALLFIFLCYAVGGLIESLCA